MEQIRYIHALNTIPYIGSQAIRKLLDYFQEPAAIWEASEESLRKSGINARSLQSLISTRSHININRLWEQLEQYKIEAIPEYSEKYPTLLKEIHNPPLILYKRGNIPLNGKPLLTIVGSRRNTPYGTRVARKFAEDLSAMGITVVSGLAFGIDATAHEGALHAHGTTIGVLGNSLDDSSISPRSNLMLARNILQHNGALLSEYPPQTTASVATFPARNRIMAGMSQGVIVIEASEKSGSLITARYAIEYNRELFAVPGSIFSEASTGPHSLLRAGAKIATSIQDILEEIHLQIQAIPDTATENNQALSTEEMIILRQLSPQPEHIDNILKAITLDTSKAQSILVMLEVKGFIKNIGGMHYIKIQ